MLYNFIAFNAMPAQPFELTEEMSTKIMGFTNFPIAYYLDNVVNTNSTEFAIYNETA
jgi:hypothetical protein